MNLNCLIIDDDYSSIMALEFLCNSHADINQVNSFQSAIEGLKHLKNHSVDLIFLDIHMPEFSGFDFLDTLSEPPAVIIISSDKDKALKAFNYPCIVDYLLKPVDHERFNLAMKRLKSQLNFDDGVAAAPVEIQALPPYFFVNQSRTLIKVFSDDVQYIESDADYIVIKTESKELRTLANFKQVLEKLPSSKFMQVHRSFIVNLERIVDMEDNTLVIGKKVIPVSRSNRPLLKERLNII